MSFSRRSFIAGSAALPAIFAQQKSAILFIGAYTSDMNHGITSARFNPANGALAEMAIAASTPNPTFLALHPTRPWLYAVNEISDFEGQKAGSTSAYSIDRATGKLKLLNRVTTKGPGPCHVSLDKTGEMVMAANYMGGSFISYRVQADGSLGAPVSFIQDTGSGPNKQRQEGPHAHSINASPENQYAVGCDLGTDTIRIFKMDPSKATLTPHKDVKLTPGAGPRHFAWNPNGQYGYSVNELNSTVTAFQWLAGRGELAEVQVISTLPDDFRAPNTTAEVRVHPSGKWLYASNRGHDSIAVYAIDPAQGTLTKINSFYTQGIMPRNFTISPDGRWLLAANQKSDTIVVFSIDVATGKVSPAGQKMTVGAPVCLRILV